MIRATLLAGLALVACAAAVGAAGLQSARSTELLQDSSLAAALRSSGDDPRTRFAVAAVDLHGDSADEIVAYVHGPSVCGSGGCNLLVLEPGARGYRIVARTSVTRAPIRLLPTSSNGWRDLSVRVSGGGMPSRQVRLRYGGAGYPANPSMLPDGERVATDAGALLIPDPPQGAPLPRG